MPRGPRWLLSGFAKPRARLRGGGHIAFHGVAFLSIWCLSWLSPVVITCSAAGPGPPAEAMDEASVIWLVLWSSPVDCLATWAYPCWVPARVGRRREPVATDGAAPHHEPGRRPELPHPSASLPPSSAFTSCRATSRPWSATAWEMVVRSKTLSQRVVVETDHRHVFWHPEPQPGQGRNGAKCHLV